MNSDRMLDTAGLKQNLTLDGIDFDIFVNR